MTRLALIAVPFFVLSEAHVQEVLELEEGIEIRANPELPKGLTFLPPRDFKGKEFDSGMPIEETYRSLLKPVDVGQVEQMTRDPG